MRQKRMPLLASATLAVALLAGACEKQVREAHQPAAPTPEAAPPAAVADATGTAQPPAGDATTASSVLHPASAPAVAAEVPKPVAPTMLVAGVELPFPATKLILHQKDGDDSGPVTVELFSDLPKSALRDYDGNELYLEMKLDGTGKDGTLDGATWRFKSVSSGKADGPNGVFLNGQTTHLQPFDAMVTFERRKNGQVADQLYAIVMGQFRAFEDNTPDALAPFVPVRGELAVEIAKQR